MLYIRNNIGFIYATPGYDCWMRGIGSLYVGISPFIANYFLY